MGVGIITNLAGSYIIPSPKGEATGSLLLGTPIERVLRLASTTTTQARESEKVFVCLFLEKLLEDPPAIFVVGYIGPFKAKRVPL